MKTVKVLLLTLALATLGFATLAQTGGPYDKVDMQSRTEFSKSSVHLFPNPVTEYLTIKFEDPVAKKIGLSLHNILGSNVEAEREVAKNQAKEEGKPEAAWPKIVEGRLNGWFKENVLVEQAFAKDNSKTVGKVVEETGGEVTAFARFRVGA